MTGVIPRPPYVESFIKGTLYPPLPIISTYDGDAHIQKPIKVGGDILTWNPNQKTNVSIGGSIKFVINWIKEQMPRIMEILKK